MLIMINFVLIVIITLHSTLSLFGEPFILSHSEVCLRMVHLDCYMADRR